MISTSPDHKPVSLTIVSHKNRPFISSIELFDLIMPNSRKYYKRWVEANITHQPQNLPKEEADFVFTLSIKGYKRPLRTRGRKREDILLTVQFARELCYQAKTLPANEVREFLRAFSA